MSDALVAGAEPAGGPGRSPGPASSETSRRSTVPRFLATSAGVLTTYALAVAWLTWPLAARLGTHLPDAHPACRFDTPFTAWLLSYLSHRLVTAPHDVLQANIYAPTSDALFYGPTCSGALPFFAPVYLATGNPALALNLLLLGGAALSAATLHLVVRRWTGSHAAALVAGATFLLDRWLLWEFPPTAPIYALLLYFPLLFCLLADPRPSWRRMALVAPLVLAQELVHFGYIAPSVLGPLALLALVRTVRPVTRRAGLQLACVVAVGALGLVPEILGYRSVQSVNPNLTEQTIWRGLAQPPTRLPGGILAYQVPTAVAPAALLLITCGGLAFLTRRRSATREGSSLVWAWQQTAFWAVAGTLLSFTPTVELFGHEIVTPRAWAIEWFPFLGRLRVPSRLGLGAYIALSALTGLAFHEIATRVRSQLSRGGATRRGALTGEAVVGLACAAIIAAIHAQYSGGYGEPRYLRGPLPRAYPTLAAIPSDAPLLAELRTATGPLLELPVGPGGILPYAHTRAMYRSIHHWRPLVNGYDSYWPEPFPERMRLAEALPDPDAVRALHDATGLTQVLVHTDELPTEERDRWLALAAPGSHPNLVLAARKGDQLLFSVRAPAIAPAERVP